MYFQVEKEETVSRAMVMEQMTLFALRVVTAASQLSCAVDKPAPSGTLLLLHLSLIGYLEYSVC